MHPARRAGGNVAEKAGTGNGFGRDTGKCIKKCSQSGGPGWINDASDALVSLDTANFHIEGKEGSWLAFDSIAVDGKEFFLMEHENGKLIVDDACHGFDQTVQRRIKDCLRPSQSDPKSAKQETPPLENWQKYMENGEYLRSSEMDEEQNYNMVDGKRNNMAPKGGKGRPSVLAKLRQKQAEVAKRSGKLTQRTAPEEDMERRRM